MEKVLLWASVFAQFVAAALWIWSSRAKVSSGEVLADHQKKHGTGWQPASITYEDGTDFPATAARQSEISGWAAVATAIGVALQGLATAVNQGLITLT